MDNNHNCCITEVAGELFDKGFNVYLEYKIRKYPDAPQLRNMCFKVDVYAKKSNEEIIVEVGSLSQYYKLQELKRLKPNAKIVHVLQWGKTAETRLH
jgi:hypothetical protein